MIVPDPIVDPISPALRAELQALGRQGAAARAIVPCRCASCGRPGEGIAIKRYCGAACRTAAAVHRRADRRRQQQRSRRCHARPVSV